MKGNIVTGLDIGTHTIKALVAHKRQKDWEVLSYAQIPSFGLRKGAVVNVEDTAKNVQMIMSGVEKDCNRRINSVFVNIGGSHLYVTPSDGIISVSRADQRISREDVERVLQATKAINIPHNEEVLDVFPKEFIIDDQKGIKSPEGLTGIRLEAKVLLLCYFAPYFTNLTQAVLNSKIQINDVVPSPLAAANAVLTGQQKELGVALIDIGASTTSLCVFEEGELIHLAIFPIGSANITNDIAIGLKTDVAIAESIKKQHGTCMFGKIGPEQSKKKIEIFDKSDSLDFTKKDLIDIIEPRVSEILDLVQKELKKIGKQEQLPGGIVLTGGGAKIPKIKELTKQTLKLACEIGISKQIAGLEEDPGLATVAGLALGGVDFGEEEGILRVTKGWGSKVKKMFKLFIP
ncbi:MAG: cell division protein FtsA [Candidatus Staskawiczbacteria bacterium RIFOXYD2_FULL_37_9]|uniref:Cell division protein FtsA n=1 Tax=Candidatus Staskawiczbacteria bacterium RIFOXYB1_FULL_37_44 TaxID=1802223 RepID=A0A1G2IXV2_9BACT|nr:MAG: cell division protein FtsA [Candidatus Staskawiczbacteria bacterium RIFOXYB1_FULL_37_44]OGZ83524.1 MAG: cell division protein FtsA [Candidatus Staskawiczbacteria bacterium RIFOXYC1_FULL_37_52]OGZ88672.1 MAG: cell division protein FtsA [Candidatus Staskawiczbacteria bacterium RIFOXYC2_FULL_37_19]OGZ89474.1 MAG: cell division protein FtsA [Candidatus Staskawiczbacteria bacterium RIFOXYD1_FULL_37_110]OGZ93919.1 MAG: cell division protein FtsA [Candidatus Staskawiczbacteria bacterium RIFOXY